MRPLWSPCRDAEGSALILTMVVGFIFLSSIIWFAVWTLHHSKADQKILAAQHAFEYTDSAVNDLRPWLKSPKFSELLPVSSSYTLAFPMEHGTAYVDLYRRSNDTSLVDAYATGYYNLPDGNLVDPYTNVRSQSAAIEALFRVNDISDYLVAQPGALEISYGTNAQGAMVYGESLTFDDPSTGSSPTETMIGEADYYTVVAPANPAAFTIFYSTPPNPVKLSYPPTFATLDLNMRNYYQAIATSDSLPLFSGSVSSPSDGKSVYFAGSDVTIGGSGPLVVSGVWVLYVVGNIIIKNNITVSPGSWAAFLSEGNIHIDASAPDALSLSGNYVCNGTFVADPPVRTAGVLNFTGGMVAISQIQLGGIYLGGRTYTYNTVRDPRLVLPNVSDLLHRTVTRGLNSYK